MKDTLLLETCKNCGGHLTLMNSIREPDHVEFLVKRCLDCGGHPVEEVETVACVPSGSMNFGQALEMLKQGHKIAREGWNGKGMWIVLMPALYLPPYNTADTARKVNDRTAKHIGEDKPLDSQPYIAMWTAKEQWQPGWLASQADMLAEDWHLVA